jgi:hypothetical protein
VSGSSNKTELAKHKNVTFVISRKLHTNNRPMGEKSPNLVTLFSEKVPT